MQRPTHPPIKLTINEACQYFDMDISRAQKNAIISKLIFRQLDILKIANTILTLTFTYATDSLLPLF